MENPQPAEITVLLRRWQDGDSAAYAQVVEWAYARLLAIATGFVARERLSTEPAALVNEAWLRLREIRDMQWRDRHHFFSFAAAQIRRILIDHARSRAAGKREGARQRVPLSDHHSWVWLAADDLLDLTLALDELEQFDPAQVRLVELRYLLGCTIPEIAELEEIPERTVERHLRFALTWLSRRLNPETP